MKRDPIREYLIHSYIYYVLSDNVISDSEFDMLCASINADWDNIESPHKDLVYEGGADLRGMDGLRDNFPEDIQRAAKERLQDFNDLNLT